MSVVRIQLRNQRTNSAVKIYALLEGNHLIYYWALPYLRECGPHEVPPLVGFEPITPDFDHRDALTTELRGQTGADRG